MFTVRVMFALLRRSSFFVYSVKVAYLVNAIIVVILFRHILMFKSIAPHHPMRAFIIGYL